MKNIYVVVTSKPGLLSFLGACSSVMTVEFILSCYLAAILLHVSLIPADLFSRYRLCNPCITLFSSKSRPLAWVCCWLMTQSWISAIRRVRERTTYYCYGDDSAWFPGGTREFRKPNGATGPKPVLSGEHRKQETTPNSLPDWLERTTKELCFFLHGNKLMQSRCSESQSDRGTEVVSHIQEQAVLHLSTAVSLRALRGKGMLSGTAGVETLH